MSPHVINPVTSAAIQEFTHKSVFRDVGFVVFRSVGSRVRWTSATQPDDSKPKMSEPAEIRTRKRAVANPALESHVVRIEVSSKALRARTAGADPIVRAGPGW
jgi:hypothetical protein